jgi:ribosomal protein S18 acetylase RimI-like enzyme
MRVHFKKITKTDYPFLREMLYEAIFVPEGEATLPLTIIDLPEIAKYIDNWGDYNDFGLIALENNQHIGAIWCRLYGEENRGYGFIDSNTPEVSMAVKENYRNKGIGTKLMNQLYILADEKGFETLSLSVDKRNRAAGFYIRIGFEIVGDVGTAYTMKKIL